MNRARSWAVSLALMTAAFAGAITARAGSSATPGSQLPSGFYRNVNQATVYRVLDGNICAVLTQGHLKALGARPKSIHVVDSVDFLNGKPSTPPCPWPDGYYRAPGDNYVVKVSKGTACIASSTDERVFTVERDSLVTSGKTFLGRCKS